MLYTNIDDVIIMYSRNVSKLATVFLLFFINVFYWTSFIQAVAGSGSQA
jgi:hypothetical protein